MTKKEAIKATKAGYSVSHSATEGYIKIVSRVVSSACGISEIKNTLEFVGDCSPKSGWTASYLGAR